MRRADSSARLSVLAAFPGNADCSLELACLIFPRTDLLRLNIAMKSPPFFQRGTILLLTILTTSLSNAEETQKPTLRLLKRKFDGEREELLKPITELNASY